MYRPLLAAASTLLLAACDGAATPKRPALGDIHFRSLAAKLAGTEGGTPVTVTLAWDAPEDCSWTLEELEVAIDGARLPFDMMVTAPGQDACPDTAMWKFRGGELPQGPGDRTLTLTLDGASQTAVIPSPRDARHLTPSQPLSSVPRGGTLLFLPARADTRLEASPGQASLAPRDGGKRTGQRSSIVAPVGKAGLEVTLPKDVPAGAYMLSVRAQGTVTFPCFADSCTARITTKLVHALDVVE